MTADAPTVSSLVTLAGATAATLVIVEVLKRALALTAEQKSRYLPLISVVVGILIALLGTYALGLTARVDLVQALITGLFAGVAASGTFDLVTSQS